MGLGLSFTDSTGCSRPAAYAKVTFYAFDENGKQGRIALSVYNSKDDKDAGKSAIPGEMIEVTISTQTEDQSKSFDSVLAAIEEHGPKKVAYVLAKKLDKLTEATDVLEEGQTVVTEADVGLA